jgi:ubiquinone/menaquinone biosynthesis C-methylase UbiE
MQQISACAVNAAASKGHEELRYWTTVKEKEGTLNNSWYEYFYTKHFLLDRQFYRAKKILDIGCGPRGSLEWADMAGERVGVDPLADSYRALGVENQKMTYVAAPAEAIPYADGYFDVVASFNSLDHVDDLDACVAEIARVVAPRGLFLLLTDVNHKPTVCEPVSYSWDIVEKFSPTLALLEQEHFEKNAGGMYQSLKARVSYDYGNRAERYGILSAKFTKPVARVQVKYEG